MIWVDFDTLTDAKVDALRECVHLRADGYIIYLSYSLDQFWVIKLKHSKNRRKMTMKVGDDLWTLYRGEDLVKAKTFPKR